MKLHIVPAQTGFTWVKLGIQAFRRQPLALAALFFLSFVAMSLLASVPVLGNIASLVLLPSVTLAMMVATGESIQGHTPTPALFKQFDGAFAQGAHVGCLGPRGGAQQGQPRNPLRRLARGLHGNHAAHRRAGQHQRPRVLCQQPGSKVFDAVQVHILVGGGDLWVQRGGQQRQHAAPHAFIGGQAGQAHKLGGMGHGQKGLSPRWCRPETGASLNRPRGQRTL